MHLSLLTMKILGLSAILVAGTVSVVSAAPADIESTERVSYTDKGQRAKPQRGEWVEIASATPAKHGREIITVDPHRGPYTRLRIDATSGSPVVYSVVLYTVDGKRQAVAVGRTLGKHNPSTIVELKGLKGIDQIVVVTDRASVGSYAVFAAPQSLSNVAVR